MDAWRTKLRHARDRLGLSQRDVAGRAGVSPETVRAYESGRRRPTRERLGDLLDAIPVTAHERQDILDSAGFSTPRTLYPATEYPDYFLSIDEIQPEVERVGWPAFVLSSTNEVVAANAAVQALWGIDFEEERAKRTAPQMNLLAVASERRFADRMVNWDECVGTLAAVFKGRPANPASLDDPDPYFSDVLAEFAAGDPVFLGRLVSIWVATPAMESKVRWNYRVVWHDEDFGELRFHCLVTTASEPAGLAVNDWIPLDAETWGVLERVKSRASVPTP